MHILYHHRTASKDGQNVHIEELIAALRRQGHQVHVVAPPGSEGTEFGKSNGAVVMLKRLLPRAAYELLELGYSFVAFRRLDAAIASHHPDVLYERYNLFMLAGAWIARRHRLPFLVEVNAPLSEERARYGGLGLRSLARWTERMVWRRADAVLPVTEALAESVRAASVPPTRIHVIPNGIDPKQFHTGVDGRPVRERLGLSERLVLGFTGFIRTWHGLPRVLDAMHALGREDVHLLVVGDGPGRAALDAHAARLGLSERMTVLGMVDRARIPGLTAAMDVALQPQVVAYASPLKLFEYLALARPVIAPDQPNIREILTHERDALLFDPADDASFRTAITRMCTDAALRTRLGEAGAALVRERDLTWDGNARRVADIAARLGGNPN